MRQGLVTILCMLGICICIDIIFRAFDIHVSWWNGTLRPDRPERDQEHQKHADDAPNPPAAA